jgi:hypothetical protein
VLAAGIAGAALAGPAIAAAAAGAALLLGLLVDGALCCYVSGHKKRAGELDAIRAASAAVARRLRAEALE